MPVKITQLGASEDSRYHKEFQKYATTWRRLYKSRVELKPVNILDPDTVIDAWANVQSADIVVLHISQNFVAALELLTDWQSGHNLVLDELTQQRQTKSSRIIPIILKPCTWLEIEVLKDLQPLPNRECTVSTFPGSADGAWVAVTGSIREVILEYLSVCRRCGSSLADDALYCNDCGSEV